MRVHIGVTDVERDLEVEVGDPEAFSQELDRAFANGTQLLWYEDQKGRRIGIPIQKIAYVAIEPSDTAIGVGFR